MVASGPCKADASVTSCSQRWSETDQYRIVVSAETEANRARRSSAPPWKRKRPAAVTRVRKAGGRQPVQAGGTQAVAPVWSPVHTRMAGKLPRSAYAGDGSPVHGGRGRSSATATPDTASSRTAQAPMPPASLAEIIGVSDSRHLQPPPWDRTGGLSDDNLTSVNARRRRVADAGLCAQHGPALRRQRVKAIEGKPIRCHGCTSRADHPD